MPLPAIEIATGPAPRASLIILHGLGADGNDFAPVARELDLSAIGDVRFVLPHAPTRPVTINGGYVMRAWYDILGADLAKREDEAGLRASMDEVRALIRQENERGVPSERIVLAGFSQGCAMALLTGLRHAERLAGLVGMSGYLPLAATTAAERHAANADVPIFLAHGRFDGVVPVQRAIETRELLRSLGHAVEWHEYPMEHSVCMEEIEALNAFLVKVLG